MSSPSLWKRTAGEREVNGLQLRVVVSGEQWRFTVARQGMKPHISGVRSTEAAARRAAGMIAAREIPALTGAHTGAAE